MQVPDIVDQGAFHEDSEPLEEAERRVAQELQRAGAATILQGEREAQRRWVEEVVTSALDLEAQDAGAREAVLVAACREEGRRLSRPYELRGLPRE